MIRNKYEVENTRVITTLEQNLNNMGRENEELVRRLKEYEGKVHGQGSSIEGLSMTVNTMRVDIDNLVKENN